MKVLAVSVVLGICSFTAACHPPGQKLLKMEVVHSERIVLCTSFDVVDSSTTGEIWDSTGEAPFSTELAAEPLGESGSNPLEAQLSGPVQIRILHTESLETSVLLTDLLLVRSSRTSDDWHLPAAEVRRVKELAGF